MKEYKSVNLILVITLTVMITSCNIMGKKQTSISQEFVIGSFGYDVKFLERYDSSLVILKADGENAKIIVSPKYQSKVFTSTAQGDSGKSFGWVNYKAFKGKPSLHMNAYGGENRFWLGPEGSKYSLFFKPKDEMVISNWRTPSAIDNEAWTLVSKNNSEVALQKKMSIVNYQGTSLSIKVDRKIRILTSNQIASELAINPDDSINGVGYDTENKITNDGKIAWTEQTGMPCMWILDMFTPSDKTVILIPFQKTTINEFNDVATTNYFGEIPDDRLKHTDKILFFKADGKHRSKLGIKSKKILPFSGSYDSENKILTVVKFETNSNEKFLNQEWNTTKPIFSGDAMNAYNDGKLEDGSQMGPFYEIESVSPAAFLEPGSSLTHKHSVFHFTGSESKLTKITEKIFGVSIVDINKIFTK